MELINPKLLYLVGELTENIEKLLMSQIGDDVKVVKCLNLKKIKSETENRGEFPKAIFLLSNDKNEIKRFSNFRTKWRQVYLLVIIEEEGLLQYIGGLDFILISKKNSNGIPRGQFFSK